MNITIGADPEVFLKDQEGNSVSGHGIIPGTKKKPYPVKFGAVQVDGMALEFNINPVKTELHFHHNINILLKQMREMIPKHLELDIIPSTHFSEEVMSEQPNEALVLGCESDYNAYTGIANPQPDQHPTMRTAAGHIHIGWTKDEDISVGSPHFYDCCIFTKQLDFYLGMWSLTVDKDKKRRQMYGKAGAFRPKSYGVEYRVLSNFWLNKTEYMKSIFHQSKKAFRDLMNGNYEGFNYQEEYAKNYIDKGINYYNVRNFINDKRLYEGWRV